MGTARFDLEASILGEATTFNYQYRAPCSFGAVVKAVIGSQIYRSCCIGVRVSVSSKNIVAVCAPSSCTAKVTPIVSRGIYVGNEYILNAVIVCNHAKILIDICAIIFSNASTGICRINSIIPAWASQSVGQYKAIYLVNVLLY